jgi:hypothetical protein
MIETTVIIVVVAAAVAYIARSLWRVAAGKKHDCRCADDCPVSKTCDAADDGRKEDAGRLQH